MATRLGRTNDLGGPGRSVSVEALTRQQHLRNQRDWARQNVEDATNVYTTTLATGTTEDKERARNALFAAIQVKTQAEQAYIEQVASDAQAEAEWLRSMGQYEGSAGALEDAAKQVQDAAKAYKTKDPGRYASEMARARAMLRQAAEDRATPDRSASAIRESKAWGSEARAAEAARRAREEYANRSSHPNAYTQEEIDQAQAEVYNTARSQTEAAQSRVQAGYELKAATTLNSVAKARIQLAAAQQAYSFALQHYSAGSAEALAALTQLQMAMQSVADAQFAQNEAIRQTRVARIAPSNAVAIAKMQVRNARASMHEAARFGRSSVEYQGALQQELQAEWQLIAARQAVTQARIGLRQAQAQAAGDSVKAAQVGVQLAKAQLAAAKRNSGGRTTADVLNARASLVTARAAARDAKLQYELDTIDFNKEMGNITGQEAVRALQAMLKATNLTEQQRRDIMRKIKGLQDDIRQQLTGSGFNIPGEISLPTAYEVRRSLAVDSARQAITRSVTDVRKAADLQASSLQVTSRSADAALIDQLKAVRDAVLAKGSQQVTQDVQIVQNVPSSALVKQIATQVIDELRRMASSAQRANTSTPRSIRN